MVNTILLGTDPFPVQAEFLIPTVKHDSGVHGVPDARPLAAYYNDAVRLLALLS
jgi:hypothetical protein